VFWEDIVWEEKEVSSAKCRFTFFKMLSVSESVSSLEEEN
jgi:hypothetical protein